MKTFFKAITLASLLLSLPAAAWPSWNDAKEQVKKIAYYITPGSYNPHTWFNDNYHQVTEGVYRSRTMSPNSLAQHITQDNIKKILILREDGNNNYWRIAEQAVAKSKDVEVITHILNARVLPAKEKLQAIYNVLKTCKENGENILIHCVAGVDRTGQISALRLLMEGKSVEEALKQQTPAFGHHEWLYPHCREAIKQLGQSVQDGNTIEQAVNNVEWKPFTPPSLPKRAFAAFKESVKDAVKNNPKTTIALGAVAALGTTAAYMHAKGTLVPTYNAVKEKLFGSKPA